MKMDKTVDISNACSLINVFFSTNILAEKKIAAIKPKKYHSMITPIQLSYLNLLKKINSLKFKKIYIYSNQSNFKRGDFGV